MCIGIKPVFLPSLGDKKLSLRDGVESGSRRSDVDNARTAEVKKGLSRKRPLIEESNTVSSDDESTTASASHNHKMMRYSSCTCQCENGSCKNSNQRRKVRFGGFKTFVPATHSFSEEDCKDLWYGLDECAAMSEASKASVREIRSEENKDTLRHLLCVASQCSYSPPPLAYLQTVRLNLADETRGLELGLLPLRIRQRRQAHVKKVLDTHASIVRGKIPLKNDDRVKVKALAIQSLRSSQASKLFAQVLARNVASDEQEAAAAVSDEE